MHLVGASLHCRSASHVGPLHYVHYHQYTPVVVIVVVVVLGLGISIHIISNRVRVSFCLSQPQNSHER